MTSANGLPTIKTYTGRTFDFEHPFWTQICIEDIAHALSQICRFGGQSKEFYSVAQHSLLVSSICHPKYAINGLMHDASEAYAGDVVRPLKRLLPEYQEIESKIDEAIREFMRPALTSTPAVLAEVKTADNIALAMEGLRFMEGREDEYGIVHLEPRFKKIAKSIRALTPKTAERIFLKEYRRLMR